jgi:transposase-like protein
MYAKDTVEQVLRLCVPGTTTREVARLVGIPERTIARWRRGDRHRERPPDPCPRDTADLGSDYAYLLGAYLGEGHITAAQRTHCLRIYCADEWPGVMSEDGRQSPQCSRERRCRRSSARAARPKRYEYPRWFFSNESADILDLCGASLDRLGIAHRRPRYNTISVARREAVAIMDEVVGPKS